MKITTLYYLKTNIILKDLVFLILALFSFVGFSQNYENVTITGINSGAGTNNVLFNATSATIPNLARVRVQRIDSGAGTVQIGFANDNFNYRHFIWFYIWNSKQ